ncbi:uncharacterized protein LOC114403098 [Glycine soja]|uniref:uncharacterized protein LOC114403098 n=1 Tax=Glycine soja TaxID=3848 RepID=UPI00103CDDAE|nr:uncharacterized protein LOC114403098 [Glycine soja]
MASMLPNPVFCLTFESISICFAVWFAAVFSLVAGSEGSIDFFRSEQAEMVITDSHGDAIYVVCKQDQLKSWKTNLMENCTYVMHNFKVMKNDGQFRICDHQYKLVFTDCCEEI